MKNKALDLGQMFENNSDCYADTWDSKQELMEEVDVIQAMTKEQFIKVVNEILCKGKPGSDTSDGLHLADVNASALIKFGSYLTGHDEGTIEQMLNDYNQHLR